MLRLTHMARTSTPARTLPIVTILLVTANLLSYLLELGAGGQAACEQFGLVPARFMRSGALEPLLTSLFLHDPNSLYHIAGNMAFLAIFGTLVEGVLGRLPFLVLYLAAGVFGALFHVFANQTTTCPLVGCSACVLGLMPISAVLKPRALLAFTVTFAGFNVWEVLTGTGGSVAVCAHVGGFSIGVLAVGLLKVTNNEAMEAA